MPSGQRFWHWLMRTLYYDRVRVVGGTLGAARARPTLLLGLHRNGAVDGFVYRAAAADCTFMVAQRLARGFWKRTLFGGIEVVRAGDGGDATKNVDALAASRDFLRAGGHLFVFPEGTSDLGPKHLPFKTGAIRVLVDALDQGALGIVVVPMGLAYEAAPEFRSRVEVVVGAPLDLSLPPQLDSAAKVSILAERMTRALEALSVDVETREQRADVDALAYAATLGTTRSFHATAKQLASGIPADVASEWQTLKDAFAGRSVRLHQGVPLVPIGSVVPYLLALAVLAPPVLAGLLVNAPPLLAGWAAARKLADGPNVVALWRLLVGVPVLLLWATALLVTFGVTWPVGAAIYGALTVAGLGGWYRVRKLAIAVHNAVFAADLRPRLLQLQQKLLDALGGAV